jgi:hypothetical protein
MKSTIIILCIFISSFLFIGQSLVGAQGQAERTTLEPVFTQEQAGRGRELVIKIGCANCHNSDLGGGLEETPGLIGNEFMAMWQGQLLRELDTQLTSMPADGTYKISPQERVDIIAFLLGINGAPMGKDELPPDPKVLAGIKIKFP